MLSLLPRHFYTTRISEGEETKEAEVLADIGSVPEALREWAVLSNDSMAPEAYASILRRLSPAALEEALAFEATRLHKHYSNLSTHPIPGKLAMTSPEHTKVRTHHGGAVVDVFLTGNETVSLELEHPSCK